LRRFVAFARAVARGASRTGQIHARGAAASASSIGYNLEFSTVSPHIASIMPIYEYRCSACGFEKDALQKMSDPPLVDCPQCGRPTLVKKVSAAGFQLKGTGWYATDFKSSSKPAPDKPDAKSESKGESKGDTAAEGGDKKGADKAASTEAAKPATPPAPGG
jgi:putative FmdB family regulatory protein